MEKLTQEILERAIQHAKERAKTNLFGYSLIEIADQYLKSIGYGAHFFGIESVSCNDRILEYINTGETYDSTIGQEGNELFITSWGGWLEEVENQHCQDEKVIRCGYCSEFTPLNKKQWHNVICEHCGRYVDSGELPEKKPTKNEIVDSLEILLKWATGGDRQGNPYGKKPISNALKVLARLRGMRSSQYLDVVLRELQPQ